MDEYINREEAIKIAESCGTQNASHLGSVYSGSVIADYIAEYISMIPPADVVPVRHGRWLLEANKDRTNYRWNVTAECSECCNEKKEIWAEFFPNVPDWLAKDVALESAKSVKLSSYCPNCGAKMDGDWNG